MKKMRNLIILLFLTFNFQFAWSQSRTTDSLNVHQTIINLFDGMREGDSAKVSATFDPSVRMFSSYRNKEGKLILKEGKLKSFLTAIGTPHDKIWDERLSNTVVYLDGGIAQVWTEYSFYVGDEFSHCGVDAFHLIKDDTGSWKIIHLMDTRKKKACREMTN